MALLSPFRRGVKFMVTQGDENPNHSGQGLGYAYDFDTIASWDNVPGAHDILSITDGVVHHVGYDDDGYGHYVVIKHDDGYDIYAHLKSEPIVSKGQSIQPGQMLGVMGSTGFSSSTHLHFARLDSWSPHGQGQQLTFRDDPTPDGLNAGPRRFDGEWTSSGQEANSGSILTPLPVTPPPASEPFNPRSIFFSPVASIHGSTDGRDELIFRREDGMVTNMITRTNGRSWRHRSVGHAGKEHTLLGGGNITGGIHSSDELIFRTDNNKLARFTVDSRGVANNWSDFADIGRDDVVVGIENIDTNSYDDILLFNPKSGGISAIMMNNGRARWQAVGKVGTDQRFVGAADFDGDGRHDELLFANARGEIHQMHLSSNGTSSGWSKVGDYAPNLQIVGPWNADGSGDDILFRDTQTGHFGIFDMDPRTGRVKHFEWVGHANPDQEVVGVGDITSVYAGEEVFLRHAGSGDINAFGSHGTIFTEHYRYGNATMGHITMGVQSSEMIAQYL